MRRIQSAREQFEESQQIREAMPRIAPGYYEYPTPHGKFTVKSVQNPAYPGTAWMLHYPEEYDPNVSKEHPDDVFYSKRDALDAVRNYKPPTPVEREAAHMEFTGPNTSPHLNNPNYVNDFQSAAGSLGPDDWSGDAHAGIANELGAKYQTDPQEVYKDMMWGTEQGRNHWQQSMPPAGDSPHGPDPFSYPWNWAYNQSGTSGLNPAPKRQGPSLPPTELPSSMLEDRSWANRFVGNTSERYAARLRQSAPGRLDELQKKYYDRPENLPQRAEQLRPVMDQLRDVGSDVPLPNLDKVFNPKKPKQDPGQENARQDRALRKEIKDQAGFQPQRDKTYKPDKFHEEQPEWDTSAHDPRIDFEKLVGNAMSRYHGATDQQREDGKNWYNGARIWLDNYVKENGGDYSRAAAIMAGLSPQLSWEKNLEGGAHFLRTYNPEEKGKWRNPNVSDDAMKAWEQHAGTNRMPSTPEEWDKFGELAGVDHPDWLNELQGEGKWDNAVGNLQTYRDQMDKHLRGEINPDTGEAFSKPKPAKGNFQGTGLPMLGDNVLRAIDLYDADDPRSVMGSDDWGADGAKIHSFWKNFLGDDNYVTVDKHMLRALDRGFGEDPLMSYGGKGKGGKLSPEDARVQELERYLGYSKGRKADGGRINTGYNTYADAVREATNRINQGIEDPSQHVTPAQMQAIVWTQHKADMDAFELKGRRNDWEAKNPGGDFDAYENQRAQNKALPGAPQWPQPSYEESDMWADANPFAPASGDESRTPIPRPKRDVPNEMRNPPVPADNIPDAKPTFNDQVGPSPQGVPSGGGNLQPQVPMKPKKDVMAHAREVIAFAKQAISDTTQLGDDAWNHAVTQDYPGVTVKDKVGDAPTSGYMVSHPDTEEKVPFSQMMPHDISDYATRHENLIDAPGNYLGGWEDGGQWYNDVSQNIVNPWDAAQTAENSNQLAIYDLNSDQAVDTDAAMAELYYGDTPGYRMARYRDE